MSSPVRCAILNATHNTTRERGYYEKSNDCVILVAAPVFAATTHATDDTVAAANANANTAKEKLHQAQHEGEEQQLKAKHAAEGKQDSVGSQVSEGAQKTWNKTKEGTEKGWDKTKEVSEKGWNATKSGAEKGWDKTKTGAEELKNKVTE